MLRFARNDGLGKPCQPVNSAKHNGYILLPVIVVITLVAAIALLMNTESALESNTAGSELDAQQARYVAEAGMNHALWKMEQQGCGPYSNLTDELLGNDKYTTALTTDLGSTNAFTISVDQDTWIRSDQPTINKAADLNLHVRNEAAGIERILLRYDLSPIAANASILSATAWFYVTASHPEGPIDIHLTSADWIETDATWDSMNANMDAGVLATIPSQSAAGVWIAVNLTAQAQAWVNGAANYGITLNSTVDGVHGQYQSRESGHPPYLEVVVGAPPSSPALLKAVGTLANGVTRDILRSDVILAQHPAGNVFLQLGSDAGEDVMLDSFYGLRNYGGANYMQVHDNETDWQQYPLIRFHLNRLPQGAVIHSARLELHLTNLNAPGSAMVHQVTRDWVEGTKSGGGTADGANWGTYDGTNAWTTAGGDINSSVITETAINGGETWVGWDVTQLVERWSSGEPNYGLLIKPDIALSQARFASKEDADPALRPRLTISYSCTCGEVCMAPQGTGKIALIGDDATPDPDDQLKIRIIESWGYDVDFYEDQDANTINWSNYDLAYVSETIISSGFSGNPANIPIGVVNEEPKLYDEFLLASGETEHVGDTIDIVDNSHYITAVFPQGALPIYTGAMEILSADTPLAPDLQTLGEFSGAASLTAIEKGAAANGGTAAARRVTLPLGQHFAAGFDWSKLNSNGYLLVQRAIKWGMGKDKGSIGNVLLVVVNPGSLTAQEDAKKALIEGWGYTVNLIDESDSQANFDAAAAANDVAYIPQDINSSNLGTKLRNTTIGVVNEEGEQVDELGFSADKLFKSRHEIDVIDNAHYITQPFATGLLTFTSSDQSVHMLISSLAPGLHTLGESFNTGSLWEPSLGTLDAGDDLSGGGTAAGRRVQLPWGGGTFDINQLTDDGRTIMQRAIEWGAGAGCASSQPLLLVVGDATTLSSKDDGMKTLMQSWCYNVTVIDDGDSQANFDAAAAAADVVYVSGTTSGPSLQDKLTGSPTPIVNEINGKLDNFGFSSSTASSVTASAFSVTSASHYISEPFAGNPVTVFTTGLTMPVPGGTLAPDLQIVGETTGTIPALVTLETGAQRWDGNPAPARRVHLPFTNAEPSQLTADGETLMQRALEWAGSPLPGPIAHWKLDETSGTTAVDSVGGYDGTLINWPASPDWVPGVLDGGLSFDGSNDYIDVSSMNPLSYDDFTIVAWYKSADTSVSDDEYIFVHDDSFVDEFTFGPTDDGGFGDRLRLGLNRGGTWDPHYGTSDIVDQQWHHLVAVRSGGRIKLYVDGVEEIDEVDALAGLTVTINGDGPFIGDYPGVTEQVHGTLDDVRFYDRGLGATEISDLYAAGAPPGATSYTELYEPWSATSNDTWQTVDLGAFGVPADAVVEVAVINTDTGREYFGGVRAVGSSLERRFRLHEAEGNGVDTVTMHVQADASSLIQHYSDNRFRLSFILLGYWTGATYVERFDAFKAGANASWQPHDLGVYGVGANQVAEIAMSQTSTSIEWLVGARRAGSGLTRLLPLHEAQGGGIDMVTLMTGTDASSTVEVYAEADTVVDFHLLGYWSTPPGTYTETGGVHGQATVAGSWQTTDLSSFGIPANSIVQFVLSNERDANENQMGVRETGSTIPNRRLDLQEAESGGGDLGTMHVKVDTSSQIQWSAEYGPTDGFFYPVGWWVLSP